MVRLLALLLLGQHGTAGSLSQSAQHVAGEHVAHNEGDHGVLHQNSLQGGEQEEQQGRLVI